MGGEVGDQLRSLRQVVAADRMGMQGWWNAREPGQRTLVGRSERCEAPIEDGRNVVCGSEVAFAGGCQQLAERMFTGFGCLGDQVGSQGGPGGFGGESGEVLVGLVELSHGLGSDELLGCDVEAVGVALDRLEKTNRWIIDLAQHGTGGDGRFIAGKDLLQRLGRRSR
jgi:hypothetical protein